MDALYLSGGTVVPSVALATLDACRSLAAENGAPVPLRFGTEEWLVAGHGWGKYRYCLQHERGRLGVTPSERLPALRFQPRAEALHGLGPREVAEWIDATVAEAVGEVHWSVSRVDVFSDWQGWAIEGDDRHRFLCRAESRKTYEQSGAFTGFEFGARTSGTVSARIYDKTLDVHRKGTDWWPEAWGESFAPDQQVHRVEFEIGRQAIREFGLDTPSQVLDGAPSLWRYATTDWLTYRTPTEDETKSRWPIAPEWLDMQRARLEGSTIGLERTLEGRRRGSLRRLMPGLNGYIVGFAALSGYRTIDEAAAGLPDALRDYELRSGRRFDDRVIDRLEQRRAG